MNCPFEPTVAPDCIASTEPTVTAVGDVEYGEITAPAGNPYPYMVKDELVDPVMLIGDTTIFSVMVREALASSPPTGSSTYTRYVPYGTLFGTVTTWLGNIVPSDSFTVPIWVFTPLTSMYTLAEVAVGAKPEPLISICVPAGAGEGVKVIVGE